MVSPPTMLREEHGFTEAVCANPKDDTVRLVYADWLEEHGNGRRAEFIRTSIKLHLHLDGFSYDHLYNIDKYVNPQDVKRQVWKGETLKLLSTVEELYDDSWWDMSRMFRYKTRDAALSVGVRGWWTRGFIDTIRCNSWDWSVHGHAVVKMLPVEQLLMWSISLGFRRSMADDFPDIKLTRTDHRYGTGRPLSRRS